MIESIALIVGVATSLLSSLLSLDSNKREKRARVSEFFTDIANTLDDAVAKFKADEVPHGACEQMRRYSLELPEVLDGLISSDEAYHHSQTLHHAHEIEQLLIDVRENKDGLAQLEIAAGNFRAIATLFKVKN